MTEIRDISRRRSVLLTTEGTYPHTVGGVSTWCQTLIEEMPEIDFTVFAHMMNPFVAEAYDRPGNADLVQVPIWGVEEPAEFNPKMSPRRVLVLSALMNEATAKQLFCPLLQEMLEMIVEPHRFDAVRFGEIMYEMHRYFRHHDYRGTFRTRAVWETFREVVLVAQGIDPRDESWEDVEPETEPTPQEIVQRLTQLRKGSKRKNDGKATHSHRVPRLFEATEAMRIIYRLLTPLNYEIPETDVVHATAAAFCGLPGIIRKIESGTPFLVTEHGVYMREQALFLGRVGFPYHLRRFFIQFVSAISRSVYRYADQVSPVCEYNARWERRNGVTEKQLRVIYNGVDTDRFRPREVRRPSEPTVVMISRVDPLKDLETALRVADRVRQDIPDVRFRHFGPAPDREYDQMCKKLWNELDLGANFEWMGSTKDAPAAYNQGDVVLLTSISEAFPYTVIEAMMCGKPVVSTNVGGVPEAVADLGYTARIRDVDGLAEGVIRLLQQPVAERAQLAQDCRERTLELFTIDQSIDEYRTSYQLLATGERRSVVHRPAARAATPAAGALLLPPTVPAAPPVPAPAPSAIPDAPAAFEPVVPWDLPVPAAASSLPEPPAPDDRVTYLPPPIEYRDDDGGVSTTAFDEQAVPDAPTDIETARRMLRSPSALARRSAVEAVPDLFDVVEAIDRLSKVLRSDPDHLVRSAAATALGELFGGDQEVG
ncbi:MAG: GT4 family glycosyltransferase PelF [Nitriliruptoraceae bacterium]